MQCAVTLKQLEMSVDVLSVDVLCHLPFSSFITYEITHGNGAGPFAKHNET